MTSLRTLARLAGVNPSTVTRALRDDTRIGAATRQRIRALADQYHYLPNRLTQSLMTGQSYSLGVIVPSVVTPYSARMLAGMLREATAAGYRLIIQESHYQLAHTLAAIQMFLEQRVDGLLVDSGHLAPLPRRVALELRSHQVALVVVDATTCIGAVDRVRTDEEALAHEAVDYLLRLEHRHIAFIGRTVEGRWLGRGRYMRQAFQRRLLPTQHFLAVEDDPPYPAFSPTTVLDYLCAQSPAITAVIAWEDPLAVMLMNAARHRGIAIPNALSILGCGNLPFAHLVTPPLTTFEQEPEQVGAQACRLLLHRLRTDDHAPPQLRTLRPTLIARESCAVNRQRGSHGA